jgi:hypothetical protein
VTSAAKSNIAVDMRLRVAVHAAMRLCFPHHRRTESETTAVHRKLESTEGAREVLGGEFGLSRNARDYIIRFNSILIYLCANSTAQGPITK